MQPSPAPLIYEFGDFELHSLKRVVVSRTTGQPLDITGRVVEALVYLVERPGQLVEKKTLMDALWPHVVVEEGNLTQTIHSLRRALGERAGEDRYIATVPGRGYRFVAEVKVRGPQTAAAADAIPPRRPKRWLAWGAAAAVLLVAAGLVAWRASESARKPTLSGQP
jgi:DNA-binding winged helix-turn-helix (wHTH) protein